MINDTRIKEITKEILEKAFYDYFKKAKKDTKHIVLDRFFPYERRISSTMSGLQTSLGSFWENLTRKLAIENSFEVLNNSIIQRPSIEPTELSVLLSSTRAERQNTHGTELERFRNELNNLYSNPLEDNIDFLPMLDGKGSDIILKRADEIYIFDIKTVQVNSGNGYTFNETAMLWLAYYKFKYRINAHHINVGFVFPYNSSNENDDEQWWREYGPRISPLTRNEVYVGNNFWRFITNNPNALGNIILAIEELSSDEDFIHLYREVFDCENGEQLKNFVIKVKIKQAEKLKNIQCIETDAISTRRKLRWQHGNCEFASRLGILLEVNSFLCPSCGEQLTQ